MEAEAMASETMVSEAATESGAATELEAAMESEAATPAFVSERKRTLENTRFRRNLREDLEAINEKKIDSVQTELRCAHFHVEVALAKG